MTMEDENEVEAEVDDDVETIENENKKSEQVYENSIKSSSSRGACVSEEKLDSFLSKLKNFQDQFSNNCKEMTGSLHEIEAQYNEQLQDGLNTLKVTSVNNQERLVFMMLCSSIFSNLCCYSR